MLSPRALPARSFSTHYKISLCCLGLFALILLTATAMNLAVLQEILDLASLCCLHTTHIYFLLFSVVAFAVLPREHT